MIHEKIVAKGYAAAFIGYARRSIGLTMILSDMQVLAATITQQPLFLSMLRNSGLTLAEKNDLIEKVFGQEISEETKHFLKLLIEKNRLSYLPDIADHIRRTYTHEGEADVVIRTSYPLDLDLLQRLEQKLEEKYRKKMKFFIDLDAGLLGGVEIVIGNTIIDGSIRKRLSDIKQQLKTAEVFAHGD